jgi:selenocysteine-specific translation elongation factor
VGTVNQFFEQASALTIELSGEIKVGDTLAYELPAEFEQEQIQSLHLNDEAVEQAESGAEVGIKTNLTKQHARKGVRVFKMA